MFCFCWCHTKQEGRRGKSEGLTVSDPGTASRHHALRWPLAATQGEAELAHRKQKHLPGPGWGHSCHLNSSLWAPSFKQEASCGFCMLHAKSLQSCPTLCNTMDGSLPGASVHGASPGKNTGVGCHGLLQGTFPTQGSNPHLLCLAWASGFLTTSAIWEALVCFNPAQVPGLLTQEGQGRSHNESHSSFSAKMYLLITF